MTPEVRARLTDQLNDLTRDEQVAVFCVAIIARLKKKGLIEGGRVEATADSMGMLDIMEEAGFRPSDTEMRETVALLQWMNEHPEADEI